MDAAYIFGNTGNFSTALGSGWSVEDSFAWAIGAESELMLPLQGDDVAYVLRLDINPAIFPPKVLRQRLMVRSGKTVIGSFDMKARETVVIPLPVELTRGVERLELTLIHPDAARPRDHLPVDDPRCLALCFHSASLSRAIPSGLKLPSASTQAGLEPVQALMAGGDVARRIGQVIGKLPSLKGKLGVRFLDLPAAFAAEEAPPEPLGPTDLCWIEMNAGAPAGRDQLRNRLNAGCTVRSFYAPIIRSLWPFQGPDVRAVLESGRYAPSRYPFGDRLAQALVSMNMPDDVLYLMYDMSAEQEPLDLDDLFANDLRRWRAEGRKSDIQLADFIERNISSSRVFVSPTREGPVLLREMVNQVLDDGLIRDVANADALGGELDAILDGYAGWREELPIHKRVAKHFDLSWWSPDMKYRWMNNQRTHRDHILDYIKWVQWRP